MIGIRYSIYTIKLWEFKEQANTFMSYWCVDQMDKMHGFFLVLGMKLVETMAEKSDVTFPLAVALGEFL